MDRYAVVWRKEPALDGAGRVRPNPLRWVWYAFGGRLPQRHREWVLHDVTCRTWVLRHLARALVQVSPGALFLLAPGPLWVRAMSVLGGVLIALWYSLAYMEHTCEHRLFKHGYPLGTGRETREEAKAEERARSAARYAALYRNTGTE
ncbi:DUF5313 family protein [Saccharopolyspora erythraea]|uniref:DUF5313 family protein n=1 Tax=Saccharopolyspora erythraea TaxID=1836 RepID=UPI001BA55AAD|nr:DUF5313 family protein [Saccharopolyspora erythraea]QUH03216.1 DUF5313 family protein [Saccharopolyspora erythraea]